MKATKTFLIGIMMLVTTSIFAQPMNYNAIRNNARFLTDRMAYTLGLNSTVMLDDLYRINYDYICAVNDYLDDIALGYRYDDYMSVCYERDAALQMLLGDVMWNRIIGYDYFYRPIIFENHRWRFGIYAYDWDRGHFFFGAPTVFVGYRGGHFFGPMHPGGGFGPWGPGAERWGFRGNVIPGRRGDGGDMMRGGVMVRGGNMNGRYMGRSGSINRSANRGGSMNNGTSSSMNRGGMSQGSYSGNSRSNGNSQSSSRGMNTYGNGQSRSGSSYGAGMSRGGYSGSNSGMSSRSSSMGGGARSSMSGSSMGGGARGGVSGGSMGGGARGGVMSAGRR